MGNRPAASILLPTVEWTKACDQMAGQLQDGDEMFVICDTEDDSVANYDPPAGVEILVAGEPENCSAKANAMAYGMERATNDRFVWTDSDFERNKDWLARLIEAGETHGPAAVLPMFPGDGWSWRLLEPAMVLAFGLQNGLFWSDGTGGYPWGGGVTFTRKELDVPVGQFTTELRQCISDDNTLHEHVGDAYMLRELPATVHVDGHLKDTARRLIRWMRADHVRDDLRGTFVGSLLLVALAAVFPFLIAPLITTAAAIGYRKLGYSRWTFLFAYHGLFILPLVFGAGICIDEFRWGSRRYRVNDLYDVEVLEDPPS